MVRSIAGVPGLSVSEGVSASFDSNALALKSILTIRTGRADLQPRSCCRAKRRMASIPCKSAALSLPSMPISF